MFFIERNRYFFKSVKEEITNAKKRSQQHTFIDKPNLHRQLLKCVEEFIILSSVTELEGSAVFTLIFPPNTTDDSMRGQLFPVNLLPYAGIDDILMLRNKPSIRR